MTTDTLIRPLYAQLLSDESPDLDAADIDLDDEEEDDDDLKEDIEEEGGSADEIEK